MWYQKMNILSINMLFVGCVFFIYTYIVSGSLPLRSPCFLHTDLCPAIFKGDNINSITLIIIIINLIDIVETGFDFNI